MSRQRVDTLGTRPTQARGMIRRHFRLQLYAGAMPVVVWRSLAGPFIGRSDPDR
jgi:hypothetical protein